MSHSSASAGALLPFGSLTGVVPTDSIHSIQRVRVVRDFSSVLGCDCVPQAHEIPWSVDPIPQERVLGDFNSALAGTGRPTSELQQQIHSVIDPVSALSSSPRPEREDGGI